MAKALEGVDWKAIEGEWSQGVTSDELSQRFFIPSATIRKRASRCKWTTTRITYNKSVIEKATQVAVKTAVTRAAARIERDVETSVDQCIKETIELGKAFMSRSKDSVTDLKNDDLSGIATLGRAGVDLWRKSLGMDVTGSTSSGCGISFSFVMRADGPVTVQSQHPSTSHPVTLDAEEVESQQVA